MKIDFFKKKEKQPLYHEADFNRFLDDLKDIFEIHGKLEQKIINRAVMLPNSQNKLGDYIVISKLIDSQIVFLKSIEKQENDKKSIIERIKRVLKRND